MLEVKGLRAQVPYSWRRHWSSWLGTCVGRLYRNTVPTTWSGSGDGSIVKTPPLSTFPLFLSACSVRFIVCIVRCFWNFFDHCIKLFCIEAARMPTNVSICICYVMAPSVLPSSTYNLSCDDFLEDKRANYQNCSVLCCIWQLCTMVRTHVWAVLKAECWCTFGFSFCMLVHGQVTIIFCLSVCLFLQRFLSRLRSDLDQTRTHATCPGLVVSPTV